MTVIYTILIILGYLLAGMFSATILCGVATFFELLMTNEKLTRENFIEEYERFSNRLLADGNIYFFVFLWPFLFPIVITTIIIIYFWDTCDCDNLLEIPFIWSGYLLGLLFRKEKNEIDTPQTTESGED
jgi:hypothetical protein